MSLTEPAFNVELANALRRLHPRWEVEAERTGVIVGHAGQRPDITIEVPYITIGVPHAAPLVIETEFEPASRVEVEARSRLGARIEGSSHTVETVVAVVVPRRFREVSSAELHPRLGAADDLRWTVWRDDQQRVRLPADGWMRGGLRMFADTIESLAFSPRRLDEAAEILENAVAVGVKVLSEDTPIVKERVAAVLQQAHDAATEHQTWRMASSIIANAFLFQEIIAGHHDTPGIADLQAAALDEHRFRIEHVWDAWLKILRINYLPIFDIARRLMIAIPSGSGSLLARALSQAALSLTDAGAHQVQDMTGQMFGRLIADRKFLATFYTLPSAAALLAELALRRLDDDVAWGSAEAVAGLRIADFACGTGVLLSAAYQRVQARMRRAGLDDADLHPAMIEHTLIGADVMPAAAHLTATMLASAHPGLSFGHSGVHLVDYGRREDPDGADEQSRGPIAVGSLDLLGEKGHASSLMVRPVERISGTDRYEVPQMQLDDSSLDLCIMNPPFTRPTNHETAEAAGVPVPSFAGFGTDPADQKEMSERLRQLMASVGKPRAGHGNAGLASNFIDLAYAKTKPGGVMALVLPFASVTGNSWEGARRLLEQHCDDVAWIGLATHGSTERAFSADTGMAEVLVIARKAPARRRSQSATSRWLTLAERPASVTEALWAAQAISEAPADEPGYLSIGDDIIGHAQPGRHDGPMLLAVASPDLAMCATSLGAGELALPRHATLPLPTCPLSDLGVPGPVHRDINGAHPATGQHRGPFDLAPIDPNQSPSYPMLWAHEASSGRESAIEVAPDHAGLQRAGMRDGALKIWKSATRLHLNCDFQVNSQPLGACLTPEKAIGGRAWPSFLLDDSTWEASIALWLNTTLGLVARWSVSTRQQQGRASLTVTTLGKVPVIDPRLLTAEQLSRCQALADEVKHRPMLPANEAYRDRDRHDLDYAVLVETLGLPASVIDALAVLRRQWCEEPSVHGGKSTRP